ncbi:hypothetical protein Nepgr_021032 [Nepenthes gracilis]|uniref:Uncharacterized protein n=1 Tax=Nepenthes gracilis TaxID=150966 RepID=A0AAD3T054_NEPGR|nr:hypothetical protein Nepgr_021032 [Nepenthes gracilis]
MPARQGAIPLNLNPGDTLDERGNLSSNAIHVADKSHFLKAETSGIEQEASAANPEPMKRASNADSGLARLVVPEQCFSYPPTGLVHAVDLGLASNVKDSVNTFAALQDSEDLVEQQNPHPPFFSHTNPAAEQNA